MRKILLSVLALSLLGACSGNGFSLYVEKEKNNHYRSFARITDAEDTEKVHFKVLKRDRQVMAEKELFKSEQTVTSFAAGKHKDKDWSAGVVMRYSF